MTEQAIWAGIAKTRVLHLWRKRKGGLWKTACGNHSYGMSPPPASDLVDAVPHCKACARVEKGPDDYEAQLYQQIVDAALPLPKRNAKPDFLDGMEYDMWWGRHAVAVEVQGAIWRKGKHNTGYGLLRDYKKLLLSARAGVKLIMVPPEWVKDNSAVEHIRYLLERH